MTYNLKISEESYKDIESEEDFKKMKELTQIKAIFVNTIEKGNYQTSSKQSEPSKHKL